MLNHPTLSRRTFVSALGAAAVSGAIPDTSINRWPPSTATPRGLALAPDDFGFAPGLIYLQTASLGPTPRPVMNRATESWTQLELNPVFYGYGLLERAMEDVRANAARLLGATAEEMVITRSTTEGMNWVAQGMRLTAGDRVAITDQEHPGGRSGWRYIARTSGVALDVVTIPPDENDAGAIVDRFRNALTPRTKAMVFSHLLTSTGLRMPVLELSELARAHGCVAVVDGAQAAGGIAVDVKALRCHVYVTSGHKWLLGPPGTGLLYLSEELGTRIDPIALQDGRHVYSGSSGVTCIPYVLALSTAIDYVRAIGIEQVERHNLDLRNRLDPALRQLPRIQVVSPPPGVLASPLISFTLPDGVPSHELLTRLTERHQVVVKSVPAEWFNGIRLSTHLFNTADDTDRAITALKAELA